MKIEAIPFEELAVGKQADGLIPAIVQDDRTLQVLMLGYMNREAYEKSLAEGRVTFYSRTRQCLWTKGETSGNRLDIVSVAADCDRDTLLIRAVPHGPTCHTGTQSCFGEAVPETEGFIRRLQAVIRQRHAAMPEGSYTARLFTRGGYPCDTFAQLSLLPVPVIASGGAGSVQHIADVLTLGRADAALAASIFHYGEIPIPVLKRELRARNIPVRL